jgi:hypothetical protein
MTKPPSLAEKSILKVKKKLREVQKLEDRPIVVPSGKRRIAPHIARQSVKMGRPLASTQLTDKFSVKPKFGGPSGLFSPGNPSLELGGFAPHLN